MSQAVIAAALASTLVFAGCETEPASGSASQAAGASTSAQTSTSGQPETRNSTLSVKVEKREIINSKIKATLRASGGSGGYTWKIRDSSKGTLSSNGATATYIAVDVLEDYEQEVSVTDGTGTTVTQNISHKAQKGDSL